MFKFKAIEEEAPPKDRVIIMTVGGFWKHKDNYSAENLKLRREETTHRSWRFNGAIFYAIWYEEVDGWIDITRDQRIFGMTHWADFENPFASEAVPADTLQTTPPHGLFETFKGDARRTEHLATIEDLKSQIAMFERHVREDEEAGRQPPPATARAIQTYKDRIVELTERCAEHAYDPYPVYFRHKTMLEKVTG